jgi:hypothetical protein
LLHSLVVRSAIMLILKGKFLIVKRAAGTLAIACACVCGVGADAVQADEPARAGSIRPAAAPEHVAAEFYGWYLDVLAADQDPLSDRHERFTQYVARDLATQLVRRLQQPPLPELDYFLQARDYRPAWQRHVGATVLRRARDAADVLVTLGGEGSAPAQALVLTMVLENGAWKVRRVAPAKRNPPESSAEQPVI